MTDALENSQFNLTGLDNIQQELLSLLWGNSDLRDEVAIRVLPSFVGNLTPTNAAKAAYEYAEAFLAVRHATLLRENAESIPD